jgi:osmotically-inducible protein OsmY
MKKLLLTTLAVILMATSLAGCVAPLLMGGAFAGGILAVTDRRTSGAQVEDQGIELRAMSRLSDALGERVHINVTSYNRQVLMTGEVPNEKDKATAEQIITKVNNVKSVVNELGVMGNTSLSTRSSDTLVTGRVKAALLDDKEVHGNAFKIVTERGAVYMMGLVTKREADYATTVVRGQSGVQRVVRVLEIISEDELKQLLPPPEPKVEMKSSPVMSGSGQPVMSTSPK